MSNAVELCVGVRLSLFVSAGADASSPLTRRGVMELVKDYLAQAVDWEFLIDQVHIEQIVDRDDATPGSLVNEGLVALDVLGDWADASAPGSR